MVTTTSGWGFRLCSLFMARVSEAFFVAFGGRFSKWNCGRSLWDPREKKSTFCHWNRFTALWHIFRRCQCHVWVGNIRICEEALFTKFVPTWQFHTDLPNHRASIAASGLVLSYQPIRCKLSRRVLSRRYMYCHALQMQLSDSDKWWDDDRFLSKVGRLAEQLWRSIGKTNNRWLNFQNFRCKT